MSALPLSDVRARAAQALAPVGPEDPAVIGDVSLVSYVDAVEPPALMLLWDDPWLVPSTFCLWDAQLAILCLASRVEPEPGVETLERLISYAVSRLDADTYSWPVATSQAPREFVIGGMPLLGARLILRVSVTLIGEEASQWRSQSRSSSMMPV